MNEFTTSKLTSDINLKIELQENLWCISSERLQMQRVLVNLCDNAREAMLEGGALEIKTHNISHEQLLQQQRDSLPEGDYVRLSVRDSGCGIEKSILEKIFDPFFTTKPIQTRSAGFGLAVVYEVVRQAKGKVYVTSDVDQGTEFQLYFPRRQS